MVNRIGDLYTDMENKKLLHRNRGSITLKIRSEMLEGKDVLVRTHAGNDSEETFVLPAEDEINNMVTIMDVRETEVGMELCLHVEIPSEKTRLAKPEEMFDGEYLTGDIVYVAKSERQEIQETRNRALGCGSIVIIGLIILGALKTMLDKTTPNPRGTPQKPSIGSYNEHKITIIQSSDERENRNPASPLNIRNFHYAYWQRMSEIAHRERATVKDTKNEQ